MNWMKRNPLLGLVLPLLAAALAGESWLWARNRQESIRALAELAQKKQERDWLARQSPALSAENEQALAIDLANTRQVFAALRAALQTTEGAAGVPPASTVDLYFEIATFVEKTRALAARAKVAVKSDERFGFAAHANEGPESGLVPAVHRQGVAGRYLLEALLEAHPRALLAVQRERPLTAAQRNQPLPAGANPGAPAADFFDFDPQLSLRVPGQVDSDAFRVEFTGQTAALRAFLNTLAASDRPIIVRSVEVEPLGSGEPPGETSLQGAPVPAVAQNLSRLAVIVEFLQPVTAPEKIAP